MNVFVLCTGRSGSTTFAKACEHFTNYTSGHETRTRIIDPDERFAYPAKHIEVDNHLAFQLGHLEARYGDDAIYVHLTRNAEAVAKSFARLIESPVSNVRGYSMAVLMQSYLPKGAVLAASADYVHTATANIEAFLKTKSRVFNVPIEDPHPAFAAFASAIAAEGNVAAAHAEFGTRYNQQLDRPYLRRTLMGRVARAVAQRIP